MERYKNKKRMKTNLYLGKHRDDLKLSWPQVKKKYPKMKPSGDSDFDGTLNSKDCKPLNPAMDARINKEKLKRAFERVKASVGASRRRLSMKEVRPSGKLTKVGTKVRGKWGRKKAGGKVGTRVMKLLSGQQRASGQQRVKSGPGRPAGVFKHVSPLTGKRVPATVYYRHVKEARRRFRAQAQQSQIREQAVMARRGVPPQITRMRQIRRIQQPQFQQIPVQQYPLQKQQQFRVVRDIMTGRSIIKPIPPRERWTMKGG